jgi:hypothetical protein
MCCKLYIGSRRSGAGALPPEPLNDWIICGASVPQHNWPCSLYVLIGNAGSTSPASVVSLYYFPPSTALIPSVGHYIGDTAAAYPNWFVPGNYFSWATFVFTSPYGDTNVTFLAQVMNVTVEGGCPQQLPSGDPLCDPLSAVKSIFFHEV